MAKYTDRILVEYNDMALSAIEELYDMIPRINENDPACTPLRRILNENNYGISPTACKQYPNDFAKSAYRVLGALNDTIPSMSDDDPIAPALSHCLKNQVRPLIKSYTDYFDDKNDRVVYSIRSFLETHRDRQSLENDSFTLSDYNSLKNVFLDLSSLHKSNVFLSDRNSDFLVSCGAHIIDDNGHETAYLPFPAQEGKRYGITPRQENVQYEVVDDNNTAIVPSRAGSPVARVDSFVQAVNDETSDCAKKKLIPWLRSQDDAPVYCKDPLTNNIYKDANQLMLQLANAKYAREGMGPFINYAPMNVVINARPSWFKGLNPKEKKVKGTITYKGKNKNGEKVYEMVIPTKPLNQDVITESPASQKPVETVAPAKIQKSNYENFEDYYTAQLGQYLNDAFSKHQGKTPFKPDSWSGDASTELQSAIANDPQFVVRTTKNAFAMAMQMASENTLGAAMDAAERVAAGKALEPSSRKKDNSISM